MSLLVDEQTTIMADSDVVMSTLLDHSQLSRFFSAQFTEVVTADPGERSGGVGAIRRVETFGQSFDEQILIAETLRMQYRIVGNGPLKKHLGEIELFPVEHGTRLRYRIQGRSANWIPTAVIGWALRRDIRSALAKLSAFYAS